MLKNIKSAARAFLGHPCLFLDYPYNLRPRWGQEGHPLLRPVFDAQRQTLAGNLAQLSQCADILPTLFENAEIKWSNSFIPAIDGLTLVFAARNAGSTFIEVGSGNSTVFVRAALAFYGKTTKLISIDPQPRLEVAALCDQCIRLPLEDCDVGIFRSLTDGDVVFFDNSHRSFMNSDVTVALTEILPALASGVLVGIHDIFLPYDYPANWTLRAYNEQYLLASYLLANPSYFKILFSNFYSWKHRDHIDALNWLWAQLGPDARERSASAFWAIKV